MATLILWKFAFSPQAYEASLSLFLADLGEKIRPNM